MNTGTDRPTVPAPAVADLWLRTFRPAPQATHRLICLPHAGGSASYFRPVALALAPDVEVIAVQYPGRQDRLAEPCLESLDELADAVYQAVRYIPGPLALFGHSMGAALAFEVTHRLETAGRTPVGLVVSGRRPPSRHRNSGLHMLSDQALIDDLRGLRGTTAAVLDDPEIMQLLLPVLRSDYKVIETYCPRAGLTLRCPILALSGDQDPHASLEDVRAWADHAAGGFSFRAFSGGHFFLDDHPRAFFDLVRATLRS